MFGESYVFWNEGMPGNIGLTIVRYIYQQAFQRNDMGFGSAIGIVLLAIVLTINLIQLRFFGAFKKGVTDMRESLNTIGVYGSYFCFSLLSVS